MVTTFVGRRKSAPLPVWRQPARLPLALSVLWLFAKIAAGIVLFVARSPVLLLVLVLHTLSLAAYAAVGLVGVVVVWLVIIAAFVAVRLRRPEFYEKQVALRLRSRWRGSMYRARWSAAVDMSSLTDRRIGTGVRYEPVLLGVKSTRSVDVVTARMLAGQTVADWADAGERLCQTFGAIDYRVRTVPGRPHEVALSFLTNDPLANVVQPLEQAVPVDLAALPVGLREDGDTYRLPLVGSHVLLVGETGSGKSSVLWAIVHALAPAIADGTAELWGVDPKAMELGAGEPLFARMAYADPADYADTLEDAVLLMRERQVALRGITRLHQPSQDEPLIVVLIDELAALSYVNERDVKRRIETALGLLLSQGRAVGVTVVGAIQDPRKEVLPQRDLYPVRVALRLTEAEQVHLVLGRDARDRGARCDEIPHSLQGVGFVQVDGEAEPVRVRFAYVTDEHIRALSAGWRPPSLHLVPDVPDPEEVAA